MKLSVPFVQLPLQFDAQRLSAEMRVFDRMCWREHPQKFPGNFALPLISVNGDPNIDAINGPMRPTPYLEQCPYLIQVLHRIGAVWGRTRLMKLSGHAEVMPHADTSYYWRERARVHVPIVTKSTVRFICGEGEVNMAPGECWIFDTWRNHQVINADEDERVHLVADTVGSEGFWEMVNRGRAPGNGDFAGWRAEAMAARGDERPVLTYESVNVPEVMTPWELQEHIVFLFGEVQPHEQLAVAQQIASQFIASWKMLWAQYGTDRAGWPAYHARLKAFEQSMTQVAGSLRVINGAKVMNIMRPMILDVA
ncbi:MAG TPA: aspartyl/asparaginyl beta-hydroxylase domain-containing protein, partial [Rhodanobacter sp.]